MKRTSALVLAVALAGLSGTAQTSPGQPVPPGYGGGSYGHAGTFSDRLQSIIKRAGTAEETSALLIRFSELDPEAQANLSEDMAVMAHILEKAVGEAASGGPQRPNRAMGVDLLYSPGVDSRKDLYIEGFGAVFMLRVPFPLVAPLDNGEKLSGEGALGSEWEMARRELRGEQLEPPMPGNPPQPYNEEKVKRLTDTLLDALKNASNIRKLTTAEAVTVFVAGPVEGRPGNAPPRTPARVGRRPAPGSGEPMPLPAMNASAMTIRVGKTEIDNFANGKSDPQSFRAKAKILTYATTGG